MMPNTDPETDLSIYSPQTHVIDLFSSTQELTLPTVILENMVNIPVPIQGEVLHK